MLLRLQQYHSFESPRYFFSIFIHILKFWNHVLLTLLDICLTVSGAGDEIKNYPLFEIYLREALDMRAKFSAYRVITGQPKLFGFAPT